MVCSVLLGFIPLKGKKERDYKRMEYGWKINEEYWIPKGEAKELLRFLDGMPNECKHPEHVEMEKDATEYFGK